MYRTIAEKTRVLRRRSGTALAVVVAIGMAAAACSDGSPQPDGDVATGTGVVDQAPDATNPALDGSDSTQNGDGSDSGSSDGSGSGDPGTNDGTDADQEGDGAKAEPIPGRCGIEDVNTQPFYAVANIDDDDPDGGLNVRDDFSGGAKLATLPEGTVVFVEDCFRRDDGGVWYTVEVGDVIGWANSAYLSENISPLQPTFGGRETAAKVEAVLAALAGGDWDEAADQLTVDDAIFTPLHALLGENGPLADRLETYCRNRICDAPYTVTQVRGSYLPARVGPEVDVMFDYPGGSATQTFRRVNSETPFSLDSLPGRSILAFKSAPTTVAGLVEAPVAEDAGLYEAAEQIRRALLSERGPRIPDRYLPAEGVVVSTDAYVDPVAGNRTVVTAADLQAGDLAVRIWGYTDGVGAPIVDSVDGHLAGYRRAVALLEPDTVGVDRRVGLGNTIANLAEVFPDSRVVEFHRRGRGEAADFNWSSVRIALEERDGRWMLVAITSDTWTI